jgi:hypothetical protein
MHSLGGDARAERGQYRCHAVAHAAFEPTVAARRHDQHDGDGEQEG